MDPPQPPPPLAECVDADNGATDSEGFGCADGYTGFDSEGVDLSSYCGSFDDDDFSSLIMCCACEAPVDPPPECVDTDDGATDSEGFGCADGYTGFDSEGVDLSSYCGSFDDDDFSSLVMCCACKTPVSPSLPPPSASPSPPPSASPSSPPPSLSPSPPPPTVTIFETTITMTGDCAAFDATAAAAALASDLGVTVEQITVVKNCGGRRRRLQSEFTVDVEVVQGNDGVTAQSVASAATGVAAGQIGFTVTEVGAVTEGTKAVDRSPPLAECVDTDNGATDSEGFGCADGYTGFDTSAGVDASSYCGKFDDDDFRSLVMCCACKTPPQPPPQPPAPPTPPWHPGRVGERVVSTDAELRAAISDPATSLVTFAAERIVLSRTLELDHDITLVGPAVLDAAAQGFRVVHVRAGVNAALENVTITGGLARVASAECVDTDNGATDSQGFGCEKGYTGGSSKYCGSYDDDDFISLVMCCACKTREAWAAAS